MTLPFAFIFIVAFVIIALILVFRKRKGKTEVKNLSDTQNSPQGPVDTSRMEEDMKTPLKNK